MKLGTNLDSINSISFKVERSWSGPENAEGESRIIQDHIDKSVELVDFGSRITKKANIVFLDIEKSDYITLVNYLDTRQGLPTKITEENQGENIFTEINTLTEYYVYITNFENIGENDFSVTRERFTVSLNLVYIGQNSTTKPNEYDSSLIDILIKIDTIRAKYNQNADPVGAVEGDRWYNSEGGGLYQYNNSAWEYLYTVPEYVTSISYIGGAFRFALFSTITQKETELEYIDGDYLSGFIVKNSLNLPLKSIDISSGPNLEYKNGFSFSLKNNDRFWKTISDRGISLFGAKVTVYLYNYKNGLHYSKKIATGINNKNNFGVSEFQIECEPISFNSQGDFNETVISENSSRYEGIDLKNTNKKPYKTYGQWDFAKLQDISDAEKRINISIKRNGSSIYQDSFSFPAYIDRSIQTSGKYKTLYIYKTGTGKDHITFTSDQISDINSEKQHAITILYDSNAGTDNKDKIIVIESIEEFANYYLILLKTGLEPGDDNGGAQPETNDFLVCSIYRNKYQYQIDEVECDGFKTFTKNGTKTWNYSTKKYDYSDLYQDGIKVYGLNENLTDVEEIPYSSITKNEENNKLILAPDVTINKTKSDIYQDLTYTIPSGELLSEKRISVTLDKQTLNTLNFGDLFTGSYTKKPSDYYIIPNNLAISAINSVKISNIENYENQAVKVFKIDISHAKDTEDFLKLKSVKLCCDIQIRSTLEFLTEYPNSKRVMPCGINFHLRIKKYDGSYIYGDSLGVNWSYQVDNKKMGIFLSSENVALGGTGLLRINNMPESGEFGEITDLPDNINHFVYDSSDYQSGTIYRTRASRITDDTIIRHGDRVLVVDSGSIYMDQAEITGTSVTYSDDILNDSLPVGTIFYSMKPERGQVRKVTGSETHATATPGEDFNPEPVFGGKDMFDLSPLFGDSYTWGDFESIELIITNKDYHSDYFENRPEATKNKNEKVKYTLDVLAWSGPISFRLFGISEKEVINRPLYTSCNGEKINSDGEIGTAIFPMQYGPIMKNILKNCYGENVNNVSIDNLAILRKTHFRKQFYDSQSKEEVLKDMLLNLWCSAYFDEEDKITIKTLRERDYQTTIKEFDDTNIISIGDISMRDSSEIYQKFNIKYNFNPLSMDSNVIQKFKGNIYIDKNSSEIDAETRLKIKRSSNLFVNDNSLNLELDYIYNYEDAIRIALDSIDWFVYNSWEINLTVSINNILGNDKIQLMDYVKIKSYFYTNNVYFYGFITGFKINIYSGTVDLKIYIPKPAGQLGPYDDPFNDALYNATRDISEWTLENGKKDDAGKVSTRNLVNYEYKNAGVVSSRNFNDLN